MASESPSIRKRQTVSKTALLEQLKKTPIIQIACEKVGIGRASYYRWRKDDETFAEAVDTALSEGSALINDMAESQLISAIKEKNITAIIFWLKNHHAAYATKVELSGHLTHKSETLNPEQAQLVVEALRLSMLLPQAEPIKENT